MKFPVLSAVISALLLFCACKKTPEPTPTSSTEQAQPSGENTSAAKPTPKSSDALQISWTDPAGWERAQASGPMRKASYRIPKVAGDPEGAELNVFYFGPGQGGGLEANVDRWVKQFSDLAPGAVKRADRQANGLRQHTVEIERGTYASGMPGGASTAKRDFAMLAAIVEAPSGTYFFKMIGPKNTVAGARSSFFALLDSVKPTS